MGSSFMRVPVLSVLVPLYNEEEFVAAMLERVLAAPLPEGMDREIIVVDDGSTDGSAEIVDEMAAAHPGGAELRPATRAIAAKARRSAPPSSTPRATSAIIQDADLEYDPRE